MGKKEFKYMAYYDCLEHKLEHSKYNKGFLFSPYISF